MNRGQSGMVADGVHVFPVRVYYEDTDAGGIVYYANYLKFAERARTELLRIAGITHSDLMAESGVAFAVRHCAADFIKPARLDDPLDGSYPPDRYQGGIDRDGPGDQARRRRFGASAGQAGVHVPVRASVPPSGFGANLF